MNTTGGNMIPTKRDTDRLIGIHAHLRDTVLLAFAKGTTPFVVIEGLRTVERQKLLFAAGKSRTMHSRHITGHAVDLAPVLPDGSIPWSRWDLFHVLASQVKDAAHEAGHPIEWGGDWKGGFVDGPHYQLPFATYPDPVP